MIKSYNMAGIYIHIPFCKTRCIYCDFYSTITSDLKDDYINALCRELEIRKSYLSEQSVETIYFGGGTPSQLDAADFRKIFNAIEINYGTNSAREITLEANPDDLTDMYLSSLSGLPFNRISIGIQTFDDRLLKLLNRRHTSEQAKQAVDSCRKHGFNNISVDLMYGLPTEKVSAWKKDMEEVIKLNVEHISAYHLTYEKGTVIDRLRDENRIHEVTEEESIAFFSILINTLEESGYDHYEISNFSKPKKHSLHNTSYWRGIPYLGCGASAHSYNGNSREWNVSSIRQYIDGIKTGNRAYETEILDLNTRYNDEIITTLRTKWGISLERISTSFGNDYLSYCRKMSESYLHNGFLVESDNHLKLTRQGIFISDRIMSDLIRV